MQARSDGTYPDFVLENNRGWHWKRPTLYMGLQIGGVRLGERSAQEADEASDGLMVMGIQLDSRVIAQDSAVHVSVDENRWLPTRVVGPNNRTLDTSVRWASEDPSIARILDNASVMGVSAGSTFINVTARGVSRRFKVIVDAKDGESSEKPAEPTTSEQP
jgi:hypothetical protein